MLQSYENRMNEGIDFNIGAKVKKIKQFFEALSKMVIGTVSEFINKIIEMLNKLGQKVSEFIDSVFGFDGFDNFNPKDQGGILKGIDSKQLGFIGAPLNKTVKKIHNRGILSRIKIRLRNHRTMEEITSQTIIPKRTNDNRLTVPTLSRNPINNNLNPITIQTNRTNKGTAKSLSNGIKSSGIGLKARKTKVSTLMTR